MNDNEKMELENEDFDTEEEVDFEEIGEIEENEEFDLEDDENTEDSKETASISEKTKKNETVPLSKYLEEKSKRKNYEKKLKEQEDT